MRTSSVSAEAISASPVRPRVSLRPRVQATALRPFVAFSYAISPGLGSAAMSSPSCQKLRPELRPCLPKLEVASSAAGRNGDLARYEAIPGLERSRSWQSSPPASASAAARPALSKALDQLAKADLAVASERPPGERVKAMECLCGCQPFRPTVMSMRETYPMKFGSRLRRAVKAFQAPC